jgi:hypothetical protein
VNQPFVLLVVIDFPIIASGAPDDQLIERKGEVEKRSGIHEGPAGFCKFFHCLAE